VVGRPVSHFQEVLAIQVPEQLKKIKDRLAGGRFHRTLFSDFESWGGVLPWQLVQDTDICFVNTYLNLHWQLAVMVIMLMALADDVSVQPQLGLSDVAQRPDSLTERLGDGYVRGSMAYNVSTQIVAKRAATPRVHVRAMRNAMPVQIGVGCSVFTAYTARAAMHQNVPHVLTACWTASKSKRIWAAALRAFKRDTRTWCLGNKGVSRSSTVYDVLSKGSTCTAEATRLELGVNTNPKDQQLLKTGHPLMCFSDGQSSADDMAELAECTALFEKCHVDESLQPETLMFAIGPHDGASVARTHRDDYFNYALQVSHTRPCCMCVCCSASTCPIGTDSRDFGMGRWVA